MSDQVIGICGLCCGRVTVPTVWFGVIPPEPTCQRCGAREKRSLPVLEMEHGRHPRPESREATSDDTAGDVASALRRGRGEPDMTDPLDDFAGFADAVLARLHQGRAVYRDASFDRPLPALADELESELFDQAAYAFIAWVRLRALREQLGRVEVSARKETA